MIRRRVFASEDHCIAMSIMETSRSLHGRSPAIVLRISMSNRSQKENKSWTEENEESSVDALVASKRSKSGGECDLLVSDVSDDEDEDEEDDKEEKVEEEQEGREKEKDDKLDSEKQGADQQDNKDDDILLSKLAERAQSQANNGSPTMTQKKDKK